MMKTKRTLFALCLLILGAVPLQVSASHANAPARAISSVSPTQGYNFRTTTITITGADFAATPTVTLGIFPLQNVTFINSTTLTATVPANLPSGVYTITVTNPDSQNWSLANAFTVLMSGDGNLGNWQSTTPLSTPRGTSAVVATGDYIYVIGGKASNFTSLATVERAAVNPDGTLGPWQAQTSMTTGRCWHAAVTAQNYIYVAGGYPACNDDNISMTNTVERAQIQSDGTLGSWQLTSPMITAKQAPGLLAANGYLYAFGGKVPGGSSSSGVERAVINPDGSLGTWQLISSMTTARAYPGVDQMGGFVYVLGGSDCILCYLSSVERATLNSDGTLGSWQIISSMMVTRQSTTAIVDRGYLYAVGGASAGNWLNSTERAAFNPDGTLSFWQQVNSYFPWRKYPQIAFTKEKLYAIGGGYEPEGVVANVDWTTMNPLVLTSLSPSAALSNQSTLVTVTGSDFLPLPTLRLGNTTLASSFVSMTTLSATVPAGFASGWYTATLTNGDGRTATLANAFRVDPILFLPLIMR